MQLKKLLILLTVFFTVQTIQAQTEAYTMLMQKAKQYEAKDDYISAFMHYDKAIEKALTTKDKADAKAKKEKCRREIQEQQAELEKQLKISNKAKAEADTATAKALREKAKAEKALAKAKEMQKLMETATFDKAVKERNKEWKGYVNYNWSVPDLDDVKKGLEILESIDSLDLSNNALLRLPKELAECPNLKHLNLFGNKNINWKESESTLEALSKEAGLNVSISSLDSINAKYHKIITGIEQRGLREDNVDDKILSLTDLNYLDLSGEWDNRNNFSSLPIALFRLTALKTLILNFSNIEILPKEIGELKNLTKLYLGSNQLTELPKEIGELKNLTELYLPWNQLTELPKEIGELKNLTKLYIGDSTLNLKTIPDFLFSLEKMEDFGIVSSPNFNFKQEIPKLLKFSLLKDLWFFNCKLESLPEELKLLKNLKTLYLMENNFPDEEKQKIKQWLPDCEINF